MARSRSWSEAFGGCPAIRHYKLAVDVVALSHGLGGGNPVWQVDTTGLWWTPWDGIKKAVGKAINTLKDMARALRYGSRYLWDHSYGWANYLLSDKWAGRVFSVCSWIGWHIGAACGLIKSISYVRIGNLTRGAAELLGVIAGYGVGYAVKPLAEKVKAGVITNGSRLWERIASLLGSYVSYVHEMSFDKIWGALVDKYL